MSSEKEMPNVKMLHGFFVALLLIPFQSNGQSYDQRVAHGSRLLREGKTKLALDAFLSAYRNNPNTDLSLQIGRIYLHLKNPDKAFQFCNQYLSHPPQNGSADTRHAKAYDCVQQAVELRRQGKDSTARTDVAGHYGISPAASLPPVAQLAVNRKSTTDTQSSKGSGSLSVQREPVVDKNPEQLSVGTVSVQALDSNHGMALSGSPREIVAQRRFLSDATMAPSLESTGASSDLSTKNKPMEEPSIRKRWWFWSLIGLGVSGTVAATVGGILAMQTSRNRQGGQMMQEPFSYIPNENVIDIKLSVIMLSY